MVKEYKGVKYAEAPGGGFKLTWPSKIVTYSDLTDEDQLKEFIDNLLEELSS